MGDARTTRASSVAYHKYPQWPSRDWSIALAVLLVLGLMAAVLFLPPDRVHFEETLTLEEGKYRSWSTGLGVGRGISYRVEVLAGGQVDVFLEDDTPFPPQTPNIVREHIGVKEAKDTAELASRFYYIMVDNTDEVGVATAGPVEVKVTYEDVPNDGDYNLFVCAVMFVVIPGILLALPFVLRHRSISKGAGDLVNVNTVIHVPGSDHIVVVAKSVSALERAMALSWAQGQMSKLGKSAPRVLRYPLTMEGEEGHESDEVPSPVSGDLIEAVPYRPPCLRCGTPVAFSETEGHSYCPNCGWEPPWG